jgi:type II secretion system protein G
MKSGNATSYQAESPLMDQPRRKVRPIFSLLFVLALVFLAVTIATRTTVLRDAWNSIASYLGLPAKSHQRPPTRISMTADVRAALETFEEDNGRYPTTEEGLEALITRPATVGDSWHKQMDELALDNWGHPFRYRCPGIRNPDAYDLDSAGPDGIFDTTDDVHRDSSHL